MTDRTTKALLFAIALGLWINLVSGWLRPVPVEAQDLSDEYLSGIQSSMIGIESSASSIESDTRSIRIGFEDLRRLVPTP